MKKAFLTAYEVKCTEPQRLFGEMEKDGIEARGISETGETVGLYIPFLCVKRFELLVERMGYEYTKEHEGLFCRLPRIIKKRAGLVVPGSVMLLVAPGCCGRNTKLLAEIRGYESFSESCYSSSNFIALPISMDFQSESVKESLARGFKFMADNPGVYAIHCKEGKDRTGFVAAILECLMGAGYEEVVDDYMVTFYNYYGVTKGEPRYYTIVKSDIDKLLKETFTISEKDKKKDLKKRDLSACAEKYLKEIGLTGEDINRLKENLSSGTGAAQSLPLIDTKPSQD